MIEYTRELLNSNCDLNFINCIVNCAHGSHKLIANKVLQNNREGKKKLLYDITTENDFRSIFQNLTNFEIYFSTLTLILFITILFQNSNYKTVSRVK